MRRKRPSFPGLFRACALAPCAFALMSLLAVPRAHGQDVAEAARQEQARKAAQSPNAQGQSDATQRPTTSSEQRHVYTNDDLKRAKILTPRDRAAVEAHRKPSVSQQSPTLDAAKGAGAKSPDALVGNAARSLGEIARRYRTEKAAREQQAFAQKLQPHSPYRLNLPRASHAAPNPIMLPPLTPAKPLAEPSREPAPPYAAIRRDPFSRPRPGSEPRSFPAAEPPSNLIPRKTSPLVPESLIRANRTFPLPPVSEFRPVVVARPKRNAVAPAILAGSLRADKMLPIETKQPRAPEVFGAEFFAGAHSRVPVSARAGASRANPPAPLLHDSRSLRPSLGFGLRSKLNSGLSSALSGKALELASPAAAAAPGPVPPVGPACGVIAPVRGFDSFAVSVRAGDSLWALSRRYLGHGSRWREWLAVNPSLVAPARLQPGMTLVVPAAGTAPVHKPSRVTVRAGDSLWKIAKAAFRHGTQWACIAKANPELRDANRVFPDQILFLPSSCADRP